MISDLNFHLTIRTILQGENFLFSKENEDTYNPTTNGDSFVFFFIFCALAALPTTPVDFFDNSSADCCVELQPLRFTRKLKIQMILSRPLMLPLRILSVNCPHCQKRIGCKNGYSLYSKASTHFIHR